MSRRGASLHYVELTLKVGSGSYNRRTCRSVYSTWRKVSILFKRGMGPLRPGASPHNPWDI